MSGRDQLRARNYFLIHLGDAETDTRFWVRCADQWGVTGLWFNGREAADVSIPYRFLHTYRLRVTFYFRELRFEYRSPVRFVIHQLAFLPQFRLALERLDQFLFSQRTLIREQRIAVLYRAHDATIQNPNFRVSSWELMGLLYGPRWVWHPEKATLRNYYDLVLRSLVESGDMVSDEGSYRLAPKAIDTLARDEEENRRHRDQVRVQKWLCYITTGLVITAIVQILVAWIK